MRAIKEVHAILAGLPPQLPEPAAKRRDQSPPVAVARVVALAPIPSKLEIERDSADPDELAYTDLLFDFRSVRRCW